MKTIPYILIFVISSALFGQAQRDTIEVAKGYKSILVFPDDISDSMLGDDLYFLVDLPPKNGSKYSQRIIKISYNEASKAKSDKTNYTVITVDGNVYDFVLMQVKNPKQNTYYIESHNAVRNISGRNSFDEFFNQGNNVKKKDSLKVIPSKTHYYSEDATRNLGSSDIMPEEALTTELYNTDRMEYYRTRCYYMQFKKPRVYRYFGRSGNVFLHFKGVYYNKNELYMHFRLENKEGVDYDINFIAYQLTTRGIETATQHKPVFTYKIPKKVLGKTENHFVVVFDKFSLNKHQAIRVDIDEKHGNRNIQLDIEHRYINNPKRLN